ncbi:hypothetical protein [Priestia koreensis]|uniref:hypothetical protein n=1 Tax=Priestia koreensis TaxID=284581 RepID=UPI001F57059D|nr:hypothetical protein [Priestia koreensis]MCM3006376.1 hypothetical protein [Priestia koreensis]UNL83719.1 hypothetical protein IE339_16320 [Priestia koreensis]
MRGLLGVSNDKKGKGEAMVGMKQKWKIDLFCYLLQQMKNKQVSVCVTNVTD